MEEKQCQQLALKAQQGDRPAREQLLLACRKFIQRTASSYCRRPLDWSNDDELSISLIAFNEAVDSFDHKQQKSFYGYARMVIQRRLVDYFRKEGRHRYYSLNTYEDSDDNSPAQPLESQASHEQYRREEEIWERREEIKLLEQELAFYELDLRLLEQHSPKSRETREKLLQVAQTLAGGRDLLEKLQRKKQLPIQNLCRSTGLTPKVIKRGRCYIIALVIILTHPELDCLRAYFDLPYMKGTSEHAKNH